MNKDGTGAGKEEHIHEPMQPIECDILYINAVMDKIKAINYHFPGVKIIGCNFHFTSAIYKKLVEIGLKNLYSDKSKFKSWIRIFMELPFINLDDIDCCFEELKETKPEIEEEYFEPEI